MTDKEHKAPQWTAQQRAEHKAIRDAFRDWHPGPEELIASGAAARLGLNVLYSPVRDLLQELRAAREAAGLSLMAVARRCGIDESELRRLEEGDTSNLTVDALWRYAAGVGKRLVFSAEQVQDTRTTPTSARPLNKPGPRARKRA